MFYCFSITLLQYWFYNSKGNVVHSLLKGRREALSWRKEGGLWGQARLCGVEALPLAARCVEEGMETL